MSHIVQVSVYERSCSTKGAAHTLRKKTFYTICKGEHGHVHSSLRSLLQSRFVFLATEFCYDIQRRTQNTVKHLRWSFFANS